MKYLILFIFNLGLATCLNGKSVGTDVIAYLGVPYSKPPVGELRFSESSAITFDNQKEYKTWSARCVSSNVEEGFSEDCLYLNIFMRKDTSKKVNVLLHITNDDVSEEKIASLVSSNLTVVIAHIRDGILGHLNDAPYAISDVKSIIHFLYNTEELLVGDITIWGEGSIAETIAATLPHIAVKASIQINGNGATRTRYRDHYGKRAMHEVITYSECDVPSEEQSIDCLRTKSLKELMEVNNDVWISFRPFGTPFRALRSFVPENSVPTIYGMYKHLGKDYLYESRDFTEKYDYDVFKQFLADLIPESQFKNAPLVRRMLLHHYIYSTGDKRNSYHLYQQMENILFDKDFHVPTEMLIRYLLEHKNKVWLMEYDVDTPLRSCLQDGTPENLEAFCTRLLSFFTRFAEKDEPTAYSCDPKNPNFPEMSSSKRPYYIVLPENGIADWRFNYHLPEYELWMSLIPMLDNLELVGFRKPHYKEKEQIQPLKVEDDVQGWHTEEAEKGAKLYQERNEL